MRHVSNATTAGLVLAYLTLIATIAIGQGGQGAPAGNPEARQLKNPVATAPESIAAGRQAFQKFCAACHNNDAKGDGPQAPKDSHPPNLIDKVWKYGSSDGEIFTVIKDGVAGPKSEMKAFKSRLTAEETWNVVNYLRSLVKP